jgi:hypothetical protein
MIAIRQMTTSRAVKTYVVITILVGSGIAGAQDASAPQGMYCGGNEMIVSAEPIRAAKVTGTVLDPTGLELPNARIQLQLKGSNSILLDITADAKGRFHLPKLQTAAYWLGISRAGFNLHVWDLRITRSGGTVRLKAKLTFGN